MDSAVARFIEEFARAAVRREQRRLQADGQDIPQGEAAAQKGAIAGSPAAGTLGDPQR
jgi:hypothetical protein